ncbi:hypothetical protein DAEQUDRAFT_722611 [Daedalea quercina L-15889]|uniref:Yeast cell wall synthesis Kre9/Knh1-like N-terminal domain-containing protein n=1 Tax=Daedalea quercina L-15889 TaxID=1314783 RepID=A0A165T5Z4_9APHY|nr:hypothetical protein DAEQUDRAFT_722611 [Daedalea quercina L-15889]
MLAALSALVALVPLASALTLETPTDWLSGTTANISWITASGDPTSFSFELSNPDIFHNSYAIGSNIQSSLEFYSFEMPTVDVGDGYYLQAVNITNINQYYAESGEFSIGASPASSSASSSATSSGASSAASSASATSSGASSAASSASSSASSAAASSTSAAGAAETSGSGTFNGATRFDINFGSLAVAAIGAVAGAVVAL